MRVLFGAILAMTICCACGGEGEAAATNPAMKGQGAGMGGPMMQQAKATPADQKKLDALNKAYTTAKAAYTKNPKDAKLKKTYIDAATAFGHESMTSPVLDTKVKYRQALRVYREVLKLDPKNKVAKPEYDLIVSIYKSMGRPVPVD